MEMWSLEAFMNCPTSDRGDPGLTRDRNRIGLMNFVNKSCNFRRRDGTVDGDVARRSIRRWLLPLFCGGLERLRSMLLLCRSVSGPDVCYFVPLSMQLGRRKCDGEKCSPGFGITPKKHAVDRFKDSPAPNFADPPSGFGNFNEHVTLALQ